MAQADAIATTGSLMVLQPGDVVNTPRGEELHREPTLVIPGPRNAAFMLGGAPVGVIVFRYGEARIRYCDREGVIHEETIAGHDVDALMFAGMQRMAIVIREFLGERHPLADRASANRVAA